MELTVLGASQRYLAPLGAGTSYLVSDGDARILLDCGNGTSLRLANELAGRSLDALVVSHFHLDTVADLFPVAFSLAQGTPILVPEGARPRIADLLRAYSMDRTWIQHARIEGVGRGATHDVGHVRLAFDRTGHGCPGVAVRVESASGALVYLGDTGPRPWLADFARGADLLVAHTLLLDRDAGRITRTNLTAGEAGRLAKEAGVARLGLSHIPFYGDAEESHAEAKAAFGGEVLLLKEGQKLPMRAA